MKNFLIYIKNLFHQFKKSKGNSLIFPVFLIAILGGTLAVSAKAIDFDEIYFRARDARRSADAYQITLALSLYNLDENIFPKYTGANPDDGWQVLEKALETKYMPDVPKDPRKDSNKKYMYWSDGNTAKMKYWSEKEKVYKERWAY